VTASGWFASVRRIVILLLLAEFVIFRVGGKLSPGKSNAAPVVGSGLETYNNVEDKTQTGRDSAGF